MAGGGSAEVREVRGEMGLVQRQIDVLRKRIEALEMQVAGLNGRVDGLSGRAAVREVAAVAKRPDAGRSTKARGR